LGKPTKVWKICGERANAFGKAMVHKRRRICVAVNGCLMYDLINLVRGDPRAYCSCGDVEDLARELVRAS